MGWGQRENRGRMGEWEVGLRGRVREKEGKRAGVREGEKEGGTK